MRWFRISFFVMVAAVVLVASAVGTVYFVDKIYPRWSAQTLPVADHVIVRKAARILELRRKGELIKSYPVSLGGEPVGPKLREGDSRTPEGKYTLDSRKPNSDYHLAIHISYPSREDKRRAERGRHSPGGAIMIHGRPNWMGALEFKFRGQDWTDGCIAVSNVDMEEIWKSVADGTPITILP